MNLQLHCAVCGKTLSGGLDTYGYVGEEMCFEDYFSPVDDDPLIEAEEEDQIDTLEEEIAELGWELENIDEDELGEDEAGLLEIELEGALIDKRVELSFLKGDRARRKRLIEENKVKRLEAWKAKVGVA